MCKLIFNKTEFYYLVNSNWNFIYVRCQGVRKESPLNWKNINILEINGIYI